MQIVFSRRFEQIEKIYIIPLTIYSTNENNSQECKALIDTGADASMINRETAKKLHLKKIGESQRNTANGSYIADEYLVSIEFSSGFVIDNLKVVSVDFEYADFIIGTDILSRGTLTISNLFGKTDIRFLTY